MEQINALLDKYDHFKDAQFNSIQKPDDDTIIITLAIQDDDGMDTDHVKLTFTGIKNED